MTSTSTKWPVNSPEQLSEMVRNLTQEPDSREPYDYPNLMLAVGLEALYRQTQEHMARQGHILSRREFMSLGFSTIVPAPTLLKLSQLGLPFMMVQQAQPPTPSQIARQNLRNPLNSIIR